MAWDSEATLNDISDYLNSNTVVLVCMVFASLALVAALAIALCGTKGKDAKKKKEVESIDWGEGNNVCVIRKDSNEAMGVSWEDHTLVAAVIDGSAAAKCGLRNFIGRRVTHINNTRVIYLADIRRIASGGSELVLRFSAEDIPVTMSVGLGLDQFSEEHFIDALAEVADCQPNLISVLSISEESASFITIRVCFAGATPAFVRGLMDQCADPESALVTRLHVCAVSIGADKAVTPGSSPSSKTLSACGVVEEDADLFIYAQWYRDSVAATSGSYLRRSNLSINGQPVWEKSGGGHWVYSTPNGHWCVTDSTRDFVEGSGVMRAHLPHGGRDPEHSEGWTADGVDLDIVIAAKPQVIQGFRVGQRITSAEDITERTRIIVPIGQPGWVKGAASRIRDCGLKIRFESLDRDVNVLAEEVDNASGPVVGVLSPGGVWRQCMIVNSNDTHVKIHYIGYNHEFDEWIEHSSERIEFSKGTSVIRVGTQVSLQPSSLAAQSESGALVGNDVGVVIKSECPQSPGTPVKVRGPRGDEEWYARNTLVTAGTDAEAVADAAAAFLLSTPPKS
eukprot:Hpha_TRINITY_DN15136_c2_g8::TRINITY_DN15136_c2_g8_i1::g.128979::m.128979